MNALKRWTKETRDELDDTTRDLIAMAYWDLHYGPRSAADYTEEDPSRVTQWPGFSAACEHISAVLRDTVPSVLYMSDEWGGWSTYEPEDDDTYYRIERNDLIRVLVGKDLAEYVT